MKAKILTTVDIKDEWLDEVIDLIPDIEFEIHKTKEKLQTWYNPMQKSENGVFAHLRQLVNAPTGYKYRVYVMSDKERKEQGMTSHYAMYDHLDRDGVLDFYISVGDNIKKKTRENGFKSNFARRFVHEALHGKEQENDGNKILYVDRVHKWEAQGRLKELLAEHNHLRELKTKVGLLQTILNLTKQLNFLKKKP